MESMTDVIKSKLTMPSDIVDQTRAARERGTKTDEEGGRKVVVSVEETPAGAGADLLKDADQISGQSFSPNDVGKFGGEGTGYRR